MYIKELTNDEFDNFVNNYPISSIYQTKEYALIMNKHGYESLLLGLCEEDIIYAATLILIKKENGFKYAYSPKGFLIDYKNYELLQTFTKEIKIYLGKRDIIAIKLSPNIIKSIYSKKHNKKEYNTTFDTCFNNLTDLNYYHLGYNNYFEALNPRFEAIIDLRENKETLFNNISKNFKTKIRNSEKYQIQIVQGNINNLNFLYEQSYKKNNIDLDYLKDIYNYFDKNENVDIFVAKLDTKNYLTYIQNEYDKIEKEKNYYNDLISKSHGINNKILNKKIKTDSEYEKLKEKLKEAINLLQKNPTGIVLSTALVIKHLDTIYLFIDGYNTKYKGFNAKHLLIWKLIEKYSKSGYKKFNLGGVSNIEITDNKYKGLNQFKYNFNAKIIEYIGDFELITNQTLYFLYRNNPIKGIIKRKK